MIERETQIKQERASKELLLMEADKHGDYVADREMCFFKKGEKDKHAEMRAYEYKGMLFLKVYVNEECVYFDQI